MRDTQYPPNINAVDTQGNSCLHCAAYRGHKKTAVLLLQNGIDTNIRNNSGTYIFGYLIRNGLCHLCGNSKKDIQNCSNFGSFFIRMALGKTALELAYDPQMIQILNVKSVRKVRKTVNRLEGPLLRRSRFLGWRPVWVCFK